MPMMRSDRSDTERTLPRRDFGDPKCPNPFCENGVRVPGEFCSTCLDQQQRHRDAMRAMGQRGATCQ